jgi:hypothetical protein
MTFRDLAPHLRMDEPTEAEEAAAEEAWWQAQVAKLGVDCFNQAEHLGMLLDRYPERWLPEHYNDLEKLHRLLTEAVGLAEGMKP